MDWPWDKHNAGHTVFATETHDMLARPLPQSDHVLMVQELARMGHQAPEEALRQSGRECIWKFLDVPRAVALTFTDWLQQAAGEHWWYSTAGASANTVDMLVGTSGSLASALHHATPQVPLLQPLLEALEDALHLQASAPLHLLLGPTQFPLRQRTLVMGILNVTPDSFSDGGLYLQPEQAMKHTEEMLAEGADIIDVGGQSSRPGATPVPEEVEYQRVVPVVRDIVRRYGALVSVDTYRASVAEAALDAGAVLVNDISAMRFDARMAPLIARHQAAVVLMHMQGTPQTMHQAPTYRQVIDEVYGVLAERLHAAMQHGMARQRMVLDPGLGFGKTATHSVEILRGLAHFRSLGQPILVGTSRKSFLGRLLQREVWERLEGTIASVVYAILHGAAIVRVHDVRPVVQAVRLTDVLERAAGAAPG
jgi:dihydropteroate synthase